MPAPKGNTNAKKKGSEKKYRVRFPDEAVFLEASLLTPNQRGVAISGYLLWLQTPESAEIDFIDWTELHTNNRQSHNNKQGDSDDRQNDEGYENG